MNQFAKFYSMKPILFGCRAVHQENKWYKEVEI